jgi:hypothetical protein
MASPEEQLLITCCLEPTAPTLTPDQLEGRYRHLPLAHHRYSHMIYSIFLNDFFITLVCGLLLAGIITLAVKLASGLASQPQPYSEYFSIAVVRGLVFSFLPSLLLNACNIVFLQSDTLHRMLQPIRGMHRAAPAREMY